MVVSATEQCPHDIRYYSAQSALHDIPFWGDMMTADMEPSHFQLEYVFITPTQSSQRMFKYPTWQKEVEPEARTWQTRSHSILAYPSPRVEGGG